MGVLYTNYSSISEIWRIFLPSDFVRVQLRMIEEKYGMDALAQQIQENCHRPRRPRVHKYSLIRAKVGEDDDEMYFLLWVKPEFRVTKEKPLVLRTSASSYWGLTPVPVFMSGFAMREGHVGDTGNRRIIIPGR